MGLENFKFTEEKVRKLKPIVEEILSKKYGKEIKFLDLTIGDVTIDCREEHKDEESYSYRTHK